MGIRLPVAETITAGIGVAVLLGLGTWQMHRLEWKTQIIERLNIAYENADRSKSLSGAALTDLSLQKDPLTYGRVEGRLLRDKALLLGPKTEDGRIGYDLLVPLAAGGHTLIVNIGWVNDLWKDDFEERLAGLPMDDIIVRGAIHKPDWTYFTSKNSPQNELWFRADVDQIAQAKDLTSPYPFILYADSITPPLYEVKVRGERWLPRNQHLQYAVFWYSMAIVLLAVYAFYVRGRNAKKTPGGV